MRQETNKEIDLLLRRLSRRQGATAPDSNHLDADELSSYAENALPAAARMRYTEHLAECSRCRELVVQLSSAAGVVVAEETARVSAPSGLRKFLASLFSPMVLRYAVPALGLIVVAVIGFTLFRPGQPRSSSPEMVATHRPVETPAVAQDAKPQADLFDNQGKSKSASPTPAEPRRARTESEPPAPMTTPAANTPADAMKEAPVTKTDSKAVATAAAPPAAPKPAEATDEVRTREPEAKKQEEQERAAATPQVDRERDFRAGAAPAGVATTRRAAKTGALAAQTEGAGAGASQTFGDKDRADAETRTVAGRRFRKQRGVWVDTAYAGGATIDLTRGSEQYRGLVGDEPEIKKIADQLDGQIIVVWKGRAYRIR